MRPGADVDADFALAGTIPGGQRCLAAVGQTRCDPIRGDEDGPVVAPAGAQGQRFDLSEVRGEAVHVVRTGPAPPVDGLSGVTDRGHGGGREQVAQQSQLRDRGVLEFVEEHDRPPGAFGFCRGRNLVEDALREANLIGEVHGQIASFRRHIGIGQSRRPDLGFEFRPPTAGVDGFALARDQCLQALLEVVGDLVEVASVIVHRTGQSDDVGDHRLA